MRFYDGVPRIIDCLRPHPLVDRHYYRAEWLYHSHPWYRWRRQRSEPPKGQRGGWWNRLRVAGLQPMRRVVEPAVRYMPVTRQCNEIRDYRWGKIKHFRPWDVRRPKRPLEK